MKDLPKQWLHASDELYDFMRGPAKNATILATAFADPKFGGSGEHEAQLLVTSYGKGRVFHTMIGHGPEAMKCVGFIVTLQRGTEWAATGKVTQKVPADFPKADAVSLR
jgi:type 1 glutamine amidotransferase